MRLVIFLACLFCLSLVFAGDVSVFRGQYFVGDEFQVGTFEFEFNVYDSRVGGNLIYSYVENLTTGRWGQWKVELDGLSEAASDSERDYFMEVVEEFSWEDEI